MKIRFFPAALLAFWLTASLSAQSKQSAAASQIDAFRAALHQALPNGDSSGLAKFFHPELRLLPPRNPTVLGAENAVAYFDALCRVPQLADYRRSSLGQLDLGDFVVEWGSAAFTAGEKSQTIAGKYLDIWQRSENGPPLLFTSCWNVDLWTDHAALFTQLQIPAVTTAFLPRRALDSRHAMELDALNRFQEASITESDGKRWAMLYADKAILMLNNASSQIGLPAIEAFLSEHCQHMPIFEKLDIRQDQIERSGNFTIEFASHIACWRNGSHSGVSTGANIRIWERSPEGPLQMILHISSYDN